LLSAASCSGVVVVPDIQVTGLTKSFAAGRALDNVTFTVADKELFTLLGPSGCGKSTTLMSIAGFQQPDSGSIVCGDQTFFDAAGRVGLPAETRNLGIVFQSYAIWPHMTVFDNVAFPLRVRKVRRERIRTEVAKALALVEIGNLAARYPHELSGGQQQRVALARAIVYSPSVLLLDEPFSNLDAKLRERARVWLKDLQRDLGLTTVFVTHDQDEALSMSDRILVMNEGRVLQTGTPEEVYRTPTHRFVAGFVGQCNLLTGSLTRPGPDGVELDVPGAPTPLRMPSPSGRLPDGTSPGGARPGAAATVAVRPEAIELDHEPASPASNRWTVEVHSVEFLGDHYAYHLLAGTVELIATRSLPLLGGPLTARIPPEALVPVS